MTAVTLAISVLAPAAVDRGSTEPADLLTRVESERCIPADDTIVTGIDVVAVRQAPAIAQTRTAPAAAVRG
jgi:hypothetical protein